MGSSWWDNTNDKSEQVEVAPLTKLFERECPYYMSYGMTYDEFWYDDPFKVVYYREAYKLKVRDEDRKMWQQGVYVYEALCDVSPVLHAFSKPGTKPLPYREKPILEENENKMQTEKEKEKQIENDRLVARVFFENWARATAKQFNKDKR